MKHQISKNELPFIVMPLELVAAYRYGHLKIQDLMAFSLIESVGRLTPITNLLLQRTLGLTGMTVLSSLKRLRKEGFITIEYKREGNAMVKRTLSVDPGYRQRWTREVEMWLEEVNRT